MDIRSMACDDGRMDDELLPPGSDLAVVAAMLDRAGFTRDDAADAWSEDAPAYAVKRRLERDGVPLVLAMYDKGYSLFFSEMWFTVEGQLVSTAAWE